MRPAEIEAANSVVRFVWEKRGWLRFFVAEWIMCGRFEMKQAAIVFGVVLLMAVAGFGIGLAYGHSANGQAAQAAPSTSTQDDIPAFHASAPTGRLPSTLDPKQFSDARTQNLYAIAAKIKPVLYQQPCYCRCDREVGHTSLLDCFGDNHGSVCDVCKKEAAYSYQQTKLGKTPAEIRAGIMAGKWKQVDLTKYDAAPGASAAPAPPAAK